MNDQRPKIGIGVFVFKDGKFIMGQRRGAHGANSWSVPGGHLEFGESFEETAKREVLEETGVEIEDVQFGSITNDRFEQENKHYVTIWMISKLKSGEPKILEPGLLRRYWLERLRKPTRTSVFTME